ncbi:FtsK/SpoIIIE domain-containing protein [Herbiconiux flava]|uniref:S-DNA-T family DNA segregation ATPase FtsK/SpoIIIE n=1 Tax=Herbiconiux flava TaxID=881268 RepID=A0A852SBK0_9MICO|nr:FtsK/SpoIIIE domain-containing protein [Herbiconiux flava]NYD69776.1 S-DNA-T family DNA segregation ATPase FtsK/SpoIIIE [Herbiconiux flava]GLK16524.1 cell division protein FtsK [Herbiconiux flava]
MRIKATLRRPGGSASNLQITADATASVGDIAEAIHLADPQLSEYQRAQVPAGLTLQVTGTSGEQRVVDPASNLIEAGVRSGSVLELARHSDGFSSGSHGPAAATLRVLSGPDAGAEFSLPFGSSYIGRERGIDVRLSDGLVSKRHARINIGEQVEIVDMKSANGLLMGGEQVARTTLSSADVVVLGDTAICVVPLQRLGGAAPSTPVIEFNRSPRVVARYPGSEFPAPTPPKQPQSLRFPLVALIAPLIMGPILFAATGNALSLVFIALSPILMIGTWLDHKLQTRAQLKAAIKQFNESLDAFVASMHERQRVQRAVRLTEAPAVAATIDAVQRLGQLMWTHRPEHPSFLTARLGLGTSLSRDVVTTPNENDALPEYYAQVEQTADRFSRIDGVPIVVEFRKAGALGVAGPAEQRHGVARGIVTQLVGLHSPAELVVAAVVSPTSRSTWEWLEWLPHTSSPHSPLAGDHLADNPGSGSALLARLEDLISRRTKGAPSPRGPIDTSGKSGEDELVHPITPAVLVVIEDDAPLDRGRLTRLVERGADANVHVIWSAPSIAALPAACRSFVSVDQDAAGATAGQVRLGEHTFPLVCETVDADTAHRLSRQLSPVTDVGAPVDDDSDLPRQVSYLTLVGSELADEPEAVIDRWRESNSIALRDGSPPVRRKQAGSLRALVGHSGTEPFYLDIRNQGPHALVGGTTGAGKSEFLQSWVLGMAAAHSPDRATFLFVDYKGGAAFAECVGLPHTVGLVTDLSPHLVRRALTSLRAELRYREHLLNRKKAKDLVSLEKTGDPDTPPSLLIVVDEFAALVNEVPEFVDGVVDVAQRGRSLGLHLILATQRPAGVIKDNLRANTNLRIALRMADADDSSDILGDPMAAYFDQSIPGRGAAKTGPGRLAPFQTGYAGGWTTSTPPRPRIDLVEMDFGAGAAWEVPEDEETPESVEQGPTDIARLVTSIRHAASMAKIPEPRKPWLDELAAVYDFSLLPNPRTDERLLLGVIDDPASQSQPTVFYEPDRDGNMAVLGTGGSGKSATLRTIAVSAAVTPRGGPVHVYGLDFGSSGLSMLEELPHVGAIISGDDEERVIRLLRRLRDVVDDRSIRYSAVRAGSIGDYRRIADAPQEPRILVLVDGIGAFREQYEFGGHSAWFTTFAQIATDGRQVGVHIVVAGDRPNSVPASLGSTIQRRLVLRMANDDDYALLGAPKDTLSAVSPPGRGVMDGDEVQMAVLGADSNVAIQSREISKLAEAMRRQGVTDAPPIQTLGDAIPLSTLPAVAAGQPVIGVRDDTLGALGISPSGAMLVAGTAGSGRSTALATIATALRRADPGIRLVHISPRKTSLTPLPLWSLSLSDPAQIAAFADDVTAQLDAETLKPTQFAVFVENVGELNGSPAEADVDRLVKRALRDDVFVIGESESSTWSAAWTLGGAFKNSKRGLLLVPGDLDGDSLLGTSLGRFKRADLPPGRGFYVQGGRVVKLQVATRDD